MKVVELRIKNFRAIGSGVDGNGLCVKIYQNNIIFLIGKNNAGKSSILNAYDYFFNDKEAEIDDFHNKSGLPIEIEVLLEQEREEMRQLKIFDGYPDFKNDREIRVKKEWTACGIASRKLILMDGEWQHLNEKDYKKDLKTLDEVLKQELPTPIWIKGMSTSEQTLGEIRKLIKEEVLNSLAVTDEYQQAEIALKKLQELVSQNEFSSQFQESIGANIQKLFPNIELKIDNQSDKIDLVKIIGEFTRIQAIEDDRQPVSLKWQGHGVQRHFIFSVYKEFYSILKTSNSKKKAVDAEGSTKNSKILLIEEPELFLHPTAVRSIRDLLYEMGRSGFQVLCATHSPIMIDLKQPKTSLVRVVKDSHNGSLAYQVSEKLLDIKILEDFNSHVCEAFFADKVMLVEGNTEVIMINMLLERLAEDLGDYQILDKFHIVNCGGKTTIPLFQDILNHFKINYIVFHDSDWQLSKDGKTLNVWGSNFSIWNSIEHARSRGLKVRRFVSIPDFETANGYSPLPKGKPATAYEQVRKWIARWNDDYVQAKPIVSYLREIVQDKDWLEDHTQEWLLENTKDFQSAPLDFLDEQLSLPI